VSFIREVLDENGWSVCRSIAASALAKSFYLAGDTALALHLGHRRSFDLDFFQIEVAEKIDFSYIYKELAKTFSKDQLHVELRESDQVTLRILQTKVTFLFYSFPLVKPLISGRDVAPELAGLKLASPKEIALMKAYALGQRVSYRDYVDLYFLLKKGIVTMEYILRKAPEKFVIDGEVVFSPKLFLSQLTYTEDVPDKEETLASVIGEKLTAEEIESFLALKAREAVSKFHKSQNKRIKAMKLPEDLKPLFRNYEFDLLDTEKHAGLVIKTVLVYGTWEQIEWLFDFYGYDKIKEVFFEDLYGLRELPLSVILLWGTIFMEWEDYWKMRKKLLSESPKERYKVRRIPPEEKLLNL